MVNQDQSKIISTEDYEVISTVTDSEMAETFNIYFVNVADGIGKNYIFDPQNYPSLKKIEELSAKKDAFNFKPTDESNVSKNN